MSSDRATRPKGADVFDDAVSAAAARHLALFPAASMQELAAAAGVSRATLFRRFPSREALVVELCEAAVRAFVGIVDATDPGRGTPTAALARVVSELAELGPMVGLLGLQPLAEHVESALLEQISAAEGRLRHLIRRGQEAGEFRVEVDPEWFLTMSTWLMVGSADSVRLGRLTPASGQRHLTATIEATVLRPRH
ncbi:TetR/AcrR family transcriptional regulator [Rhodococcus sp. IEGM 1381]|uniref:TetR/AcrR family transcriptional regulator n=1 Tax=Rhodococcus sp. IEGM 1381 TaxID=3047085 RepID=UPI0024B73E01|nr:TetR/AcrR family transcriptional regulator [Rhodococcus sp. IEGM 1381]MDI9894352.1 TetR/AcrR family transcriptional regulator [Rhodococcus sp. IEGM 1381]